MSTVNGLKFSFRKTEEEGESPIDTPRFPSIEIIRQSKSNKEEKNVIVKKGDVPEGMRFSFEMSQGRNEDGTEAMRRGKTDESKIKAKLLHILQIEGADNVGQNENRSVRSVQSLKQKLANRSSSKKVVDVKKQLTNKNGRSLSTLLQLRLASSKDKGDTKNRLTNINFSSLSLGEGILANETSKKIIKQSKQMSPQSKRAIFMEEKAHLSESKKDVTIADSLSVLAVREGKGHSFKSLFHKVKPVLQLKGRLFSNQRIQSMTRKIQEFHQ